MAWDDGITGVHLAIASSNHPRIGVLAGPGTGKTSLGLMRRVARLLETGACEPEDILVLTFTRTAAMDLVQKLADLGSPNAGRVSATTIHSFCFSMLQSEAVLLATGRAPRVLLEHERDLMLRDVNGPFGRLAERRALLNAFEAGWARLQSDHPGAPTDPTDQGFQAQVLRWLREHHAMLIGEVVPLAYGYLRSNPMSAYRHRYRHVIVDEYQDLNALEQRLVELLVDEGGSVCVVGDDDQSIYRFRHANPEGIRAFVTASNVEPYEIHECGRCAPEIVELSNSLLAAGGNRTKPPLVSVSPRHADVSVVQWPSIAEEIDGLAGTIAGDIAASRHEAGDYLVLVNRRQIGYQIRARLRELSVEAHSYFQDNALKTSGAAQVSLALLRLLVDPCDRTSYRVWMGAGDGSGRRDAYARVRAEVFSSNLSGREVVQAVAIGNIALTIPSLVARERALAARLASFQALPNAELVDDLFPDSDPDQSLMRELALIVLQGAPGAAELLAGMLGGITQPEVPQQPDFVRIMSLHKSKGLTSRVVIVASCVDGILPTVDGAESLAEQEAARLEQRRLFFVAITRASEELVLSYPFRARVAEAYALRINLGARSRIANEWWGRCISTPYLAELGPSAPAALASSDWLANRALP